MNLKKITSITLSLAIAAFSVISFTPSNVLAKSSGQAIQESQFNELSEKAVIGTDIVNYAKNFVDKIYYKWGGTTPEEGFDCSGLVLYVYKHFSITLPHSSKGQYGEGTHVSKANLKPGDLVFFGPSVSGIHHVGIYAGNGKFIESPHKGLKVRISSLNERNDFVGATRILKE